jgi:hypothetical protein
MTQRRDTTLSRQQAGHLITSNSCGAADDRATREKKEAARVAFSFAPDGCPRLSNAVCCRWRIR